MVRGDALTAEGLPQALDGVQVAYYLIHSMERSRGDVLSFEERERLAAENFASAAAAAGVRRIVFLGGLVPRADARTGAPADATRERRPRATWRAASRSSGAAGGCARFARAARVHRGRRALAILPPAGAPGGADASTHAARLAQLPHPANRHQRDVTAMLAACATTPLSGRSLDIAGPDVLTYGEMLTAIAELMLVNRPTLSLGVNLTGITARVAAAIASEDPELVVPLMEGLQGDLLPADDHAAELLDVRLHSFDSAVEHASGRMGARSSRWPHVDEPP